MHKQIPASIEEVIQTEITTQEKTVSAVSSKNRSPVKRKIKEKTQKGAKFKEKFDGDVIEKSDETTTPKTIAEIVTGKGLSVPMCDGEEVVRFSLFYNVSQIFINNSLR